MWNGLGGGGREKARFNGVYKDFEKCCQDMLFACGLTFCYDEEVKFTTLGDYIGCHLISLNQPSYVGWPMPKSFVTLE